jgi:hypothetical protein
VSEIDERLKRLSGARKDFEVRYRFYLPGEGGRKTGPPSQPYRSDWIYDGDDVSDRLYMIWPIFVNDTGAVRDLNEFVPSEGIAQMHIVNEELRASLHAKRLKPGVRGYFMEGPHRVAEAMVTKLLAIAEIVSASDDSS